MMKTSRLRAIVFLLGALPVIMVCSLPGVLADVPSDEVPPGSLEMILLLILTIVGVIAIFTLLKRGSIRLMRRDRK